MKILSPNRRDSGESPGLLTITGTIARRGPVYPPDEAVQLWDGSRRKGPKTP